jgi:hypothetical protein
MNYERLLENNSELKNAFENFSAGKQTSRFETAGYALGGDAFKEVEKFTAMSRGERNIWDD